MSELNKTTRDASTYQKIPPPKSLRGEEDAEVTWDIILKRYPNAAPLLCEMEDVIERAESLLRQLRAPYTHVLERSSSFQIADSEDETQILGFQNVEESTEVSMTSEQDSRLDNSAAETPEILSESKISGAAERRDDESISDRRNISLEEETVSFRDVQTVARFDSEETNVLNSESENSSILASPTPEFALSNSTANLTESQKSLEVEKSRSLAAWAEVVGEKATPSSNSKGGKAPASGLKEDSVSEHTRRLTALKSGPMQQITKLNMLGKKEEMMQRFAGTIATAANVVDCATRMQMERTGETIPADAKAKVEAPASEAVKKNPDEMEAAAIPVVNESGERTEGGKDLRGSSCRVKETSDESIVNVETNKLDDRVRGNGDEDRETKPGASNTRSPIEILDEYSKICDVPVEYKNHSPSCSYNKSVIVKCSMGGFAFEACAQSRKTAKSSAAAKLLRCLAGRQIDGEERTANLTPLTRKQIEEIIGLGNGGEHETAIRKLYKICVEENAPEPVYHTVQESKSIHGNRYTVKCEALGHTTSGFGIRINIAKRVAADELLHTYHKTRNPAN